MKVVRERYQRNLYFPADRTFSSDKSAQFAFDKKNLSRKLNSEQSSSTTKTYRKSACRRTVSKKIRYEFVALNVQMMSRFCIAERAGEFVARALEYIVYEKFIAQIFREGITPSAVVYVNNNVAGMKAVVRHAIKFIYRRARKAAVVSAVDDLAGKRTFVEARLQEGGNRMFVVRKSPDDRTGSEKKYLTTKILRNGGRPPDAAANVPIAREFVSMNKIILFGTAKG